MKRDYIAIDEHKDCAWDEDMIRRSGLPWDVRRLLHDMCWHMDKTPVANYVQRAREIMSLDKTPARP